MTAAPNAGYLPVTRRSLDLEDYIDIARRHLGWILGPAFAGLVISMVVAFLMPNMYYSSADMEITPAQISDTLVPPAVAQQLTDRILYMKNQILSRQSLSGVIQDLDLYKAERAKMPLDDVIDQMRGNVGVDVRGLEGGGRRGATFTIVFGYSDRFKARDTVQALVTRFNNANQQAQRLVTGVVNDFTTEQVTEAKSNLDKIQQALMQFRTENPGKLPEQSSINISELTALTNQLGSINDALNRLSQERTNLQTRLHTITSTIDNYRLFDQSPGNPLTPIGRQNERLVTLERTIIQMESDLAVARKTFKETYPDIRDAETRLGVLKAERDDLRKKEDEFQKRREQEAAEKGDIQKLSNTTDFALRQRLTELKGEVDSINTSLKLCDTEAARLKQAQESVTRDIETYKQRLAATTGLAVPYEELLRQERLASQKYEELIHKQQIVDQNTELVQRQAGEQLEMLNPPSLPDTPARPNRSRYIAMGFAMSFVIGLALAGVQEARDTSLKNLKDVRAYTNLPVLSSIPLLENSALVKRRRRIGYVAWSAGIIVGVIAVSCVLYYHYAVAG